MKETHFVTGAFSYSGRYITRRLLARGVNVRTMTGKTPGAGDSDLVEVFSYLFDDFEKMVDALRGASVVYNTYWVRFNHGSNTYDLAVENTKKLIDAAVAAGVRRFVHVSITNPSEDSALPYFNGKAILERYLKESGLSYAILRPTVLFGREDILINNVAWILRRFPVFGMIGDGGYEVQPVYVDDLAELAVRMGEPDENVVMDAVGPETFKFRDLVSLIRNSIGSKSLIVSMKPATALLFARIIGGLVGDVLLTRDEVDGLMGGLLVSGEPPTCPTKFTDWLSRNSSRLGRSYSSEIARHYD